MVNGDIGILLYEDPRFEDAAARIAQRVPGVITVLMRPSQRHRLIAETATLRLERPDGISISDPCAMGYSGGTTGRPKGIVRSHRSYATNAIYTAFEWEWPPELRFLATTPLSHSAGIMTCPILLRGGTVVMMEKFTVADFPRFVAEHRITCTFLVPTMIYRILDSEDIVDSDLNTLETVIYGAARILPHRLADAVRRFGPIFMQLYGQAEAPNLITVLRRSEHRLDHPERLSSSGRPVGCTQAALLDEDDREVPSGATGEICVRGPIVMDGYWRLPELTAQTLRNGWLHTGDVGRMDDDGYLYVVDRKKDMIITGGLNVYASEVEDVLIEHPGVGAVGVVGLPDDDWGEVVTAFVVPQADMRPDAGELIGLVKDRKGSVQAPKTVHFVDELPLTALGKPDKKALRDLGARLQSA